MCNEVKKYILVFQYIPPKICSYKWNERINGKTILSILFFSQHLWFVDLCNHFDYILQTDISCGGRPRIISEKSAIKAKVFIIGWRDWNKGSVQVKLSFISTIVSYDEMTCYIFEYRKNQVFWIVTKLKGSLERFNFCVIEKSEILSIFSNSIDWQLTVA